MDVRWFREDRKIKDKNEQLEAKKESEKALKNSTLFQRRLDQILDDMLAGSYRDDEDFSKPGWQREHIANIARRKALCEVKKLISLK